MSNSAYIRDISSLEQLKISIAKFCEGNESQLFAIDSKLQSRIDNLKSLESQFLRMIESAEDELRSAKNALYSCEADTYEDEDGNTVYPNCDYEKEGVIGCRKKIELAEFKYNSFKREIRNVEKSISEYQSPKIRYKTLIQFEKEAATSSLKQLINGAENYLSVSSPNSDSFSNRTGLLDSLSKVDPTMIVAATIDVAEIIIMSIFSFFGLGENLLTVSNTKKNGLIKTIFSENGTEYICSELKIANKKSGNFGKIVSIGIPQSLENEKIGKNLIGNMEAICRANECKEIQGWASMDNISFYKNLGYTTRNEIKEVGSEVFKSIESNFYSLQQNAKSAFQNINNADFINGKNIGKQQVNPLNVISPDEMNDEKFWNHHGENQARYFDLIEKYEKCNDLLQSGKTLDEIRIEDSWIANAYDIFHGSEPIRLLKSGDYYKIDSNGRHRIAAAQMYFLQTGKIVFLPVDVFEKK